MNKWTLFYGCCVEFEDFNKQKYIACVLNKCCVRLFKSARKKKYK